MIYCTGYYVRLADGRMTVHHDGRTCPAHEAHDEEA